jgi:hypothetical protein
MSCASWLVWFATVKCTTGCWATNTSLVGAEAYPTATINVSGCPGGPQTDVYFGNRLVQTTQCPTIGGTLITIMGANFDGIDGVPVVTVGSARVDIQSRNISYIVAQLPAGSGTGLTLSVRVGRRLSQTRARRMQLCPVAKPAFSDFGF